MNKRTITAMLLGFFLPGAGHLYLGRRSRAAAFFGIIAVLFVIGLLIDGKLYMFEAGKPLTILATLGSMGSGLLYFVARFFGPFGDVQSITYEYGTAFALTAGLMNLLLVLDCFDLAQGRKE